MTTPPPDGGNVDLTLGVGEVHDLALAGLGTAGFRWDYTVEDGDGVVEVSRGHATPEPGGVGRSATEHVIISALAPGAATVGLTQSRPWERDKPPRSAIQVHIEVLGS
jgi:predicted secreted protein